MRRGLICLLLLLVRCAPEPAGTACVGDQDCPESFECSVEGLCQRLPTALDAAGARDSAALDASIPDRPTADSVVLDMTLSDAWSPDAALPDAWSPDAALADAWSPDAALADAWSPDAAQPDAWSPDAALPDAWTPDAAQPDTWAPDMALPDTSPTDADPCGHVTCGNGFRCRSLGDGGFDCVCDGLICGSVCIADASCCDASDCSAQPLYWSCTDHTCVERTLVEKTYQDSVASGYSGTQDTWIGSWPQHESTPQGLSAVLKQRYPDVMATLIRFDISDIPPGSTVLQAELSLYSNNRSNSNSIAVSVYRLLRDWDEVSATWHDAALFNPWDVEGCNGVGADRSDTQEDTVVINGSEWSMGWLSWTITALVQSWVDLPGENYGAVLRAMECCGDVEYAAVSSDSVNPDPRPRLSITYLTP